MRASPQLLDHTSVLTAWACTHTRARVWVVCGGSRGAPCHTACSFVGVWFDREGRRLVRHEWVRAAIAPGRHGGRETPVLTLTRDSTSSRKDRRCIGGS